MMSLKQLFVDGPLVAPPGKVWRLVPEITARGCGVGPKCQGVRLRHHHNHRHGLALGQQVVQDLGGNRPGGDPQIERDLKRAVVEVKNSVKGHDNGHKLVGCRRTTVDFCRARSNNRSLRAWFRARRVWTSRKFGGVPGNQQQAGVDMPLWFGACRCPDPQLRIRRG